MKKIIKAILATTILILSTQSNAALMTDLPSDTYLTSNGIDWTWASRWGTSSGNAPELPSFHSGWRFATTDELDYLFNNLVDAFINGGNPIESTEYWNDPAQIGVDQGDLSAGYIMSGPNTMSFGPGVQTCPNAPCDTFYVRGTIDVPAPASLPLLALGLIVLYARRKA